VRLLTMRNGRSPSQSSSFLGSSRTAQVSKDGHNLMVRDGASAPLNHEERAFLINRSSSDDRVRDASSKDEQGCGRLGSKNG